MGTKKERLTLGRVAARRVLDGAKKHATRDVVVIGKGKDGDLYLASSMPNRCSQELLPQIALVQEALKRLRRYHRNALRYEASLTAEA
jgi:hypothetical protein